MTVTLGKRTPEASLLTLLQECHERIRRFAALAVRLGSAEHEPPASLAEACVHCARYFSEALPLHVADEDQSLRPRLWGHSARVDEALELMAQQHREHQGPLAQLTAALAALAAAPAQPGLRDALRQIAAPLQEAFLAHLALEEAEVFPVVARWSAEQQQAVVLELRERRAAQLG